MKFALALVLIAAALGILEAARFKVDITRFSVGQTPVTAYETADADGPVLVIAHGFAGSEQMMQGYALPLARAGYRVYTFEFFGHGRHPDPMSGDLDAIDGTTRLLVDQTTDVVNALSSDDRPVGLLGHSMATDILVRAAEPRTDIGPVVLVSAFSSRIDATTPRTLLLISGAWESRLRAFGVEAVRMIDPEAAEGETVRDGGITRRAVAAPFSEHVAVLHSRVARKEALLWIDEAYGRTSDARIWPTGWAILGLLAGLVMLFAALADRVPVRPVPPVVLGRGQIAALTLVPMVAAPLLAVPLNTGFLPVLVADYLMLHLLIFGAVQLALCRFWGVRMHGVSVAAFVMIVIGCIVVGVALDRYAANFWPTTQRFWIIGAMLIGAVPFMIADMTLTHQASALRRLCFRGGFLVSLGLAVALDFSALFFLIMIAPVMVLFYIVFGTMGRSLAKRAGPLPSGVALGLVLAWALGVSFPLFQALH